MLLNSPAPPSTTDRIKNLVLPSRQCRFTVFPAGDVATPLITALGGQTQEDLCEFKDRLLYTEFQDSQACIVRLSLNKQKQTKNHQQRGFPFF